MHLVVTLAPYGDHKTTVAYGQFSKHSSLWLELIKKDALVVDSVGLGGRYRIGGDLGSNTLNTALENVFKRKHPQNLLYVKADHRGRGKNEEFHFNEDWLMNGSFLMTL